MSPRYSIPLLVLLFACASFAQYNASGVMNSDFHWHLLNGSRVLDQLSLPATDYLSWTMDGKPYRLTQWGGEVLMAAAFRFAGMDGIRCLVSMVVAGTFLFLYGTARRHFSNALAAFALTASLSAGCLLTLYGRPQIFSFLLFSSYVWLVDRWITSRKPIYLVALPVAMALWPSLHGGFPMGLLYLGVISAGCLTDGFVGRDARRSLGVAVPILSAGAAAALLVAANPYGFDVWKSVFEVASSAVTKSKVIHEWRSPALADLYGGQLVILIAALVAAVGFSRKKLSVGDVVVFLAFFLLAFDAQRNMPYFMMVMIPIIARLAAETPMFDRLSSQLPARLGVKHFLLLACAIPLLVFARAGLEGYGKKEEERFFASDAINYLVANGRTERLMHDFHFGGYIAFHHPDVKIFADSRFDLYGDDFVIGFTRAMNGLPGCLDFIEKWRPETIMLPLASPLRTILSETSRYREVFSGQSQVILVRESR